MRLEQRAVRIALIQPLRLFAGRAEFLPPSQRVDIIEPHLHIGGFKHARAFEQKLGIVEDAQLDPNLRQKTHSFDRFRIGPQEVAADFLGAQQATFMEVIGHRNQFARQSSNPVRLRFRRGSFRPGLQFGKSAPACLQRGIEAGRAGESGNCITSAALRLGEMPRLLPRAAIFGHGCVKSRQRIFRLTELAEITLSDCYHIQRLGIVRSIGQHRFGLRQTACEITRLQRLLRRRQLLFKRRHHAPLTKPGLLTKQSGGSEPVVRSRRSVSQK